MNKRTDLSCFIIGAGPVVSRQTAGSDHSGPRNSHYPFAQFVEMRA